VQEIIVSQTTAHRTSVADHVREIERGYAAEIGALESYGPLVAAFNVAFGGFLIGYARSGRTMPEHVSAGDVVLLATATHKLSRIITKDRVMSAVRAPFTRFQRASGHGEVEEEARGEGLRRAIGELLVCPYCVGLWVAGAFSVARIMRPRETRVVAAAFTMLFISDGLQLAYKAAENAVDHAAER
jgi:hypothetical protein